MPLNIAITANLKSLFANSNIWVVLRLVCLHWLSFFLVSVSQFPCFSYVKYFWIISWILWVLWGTLDSVIFLQRVFLFLSRKLNWLDSNCKLCLLGGSPNLNIIILSLAGILNIFPVHVVQGSAGDLGKVYTQNLEFLCSGSLSRLDFSFTLCGCEWTMPWTLQSGKTGFSIGVLAALCSVDYSLTSE